MFQPGTLIYFNPFYFKNGAASKSKYFIMLKEIDDQYILASLSWIFFLFHPLGKPLLPSNRGWHSRKPNSRLPVGKIAHPLFNYGKKEDSHQRPDGRGTATGKSR